MTRPSMLDLHRLSEDDRIRLVAAAIKEGKTIGVLVDDVPGKPDRYLRKIRALVPDVQVIYRGPGPTPGAYTLKLGPLRA